MKKYLKIAKSMLISAIKFNPEYIFSIFSVVMYVFVFNSLWKYILGTDGTVLGYTKPQLIWYIIIAEWAVTLNVVYYRKIVEIVRSEKITSYLTKPINFIFYLISESSGILFKAALNLAALIIFGFFLTGFIKTSYARVIFFFISLLFSILLGITLQIFLGVLGFFTKEVFSAFLILQKISFLVVFMPLEALPQPFRNIIFCLPTTSMIYIPAKIFVNFEKINVFLFLGLQTLELLLMLAVVLFIYKKGVKKISDQGSI